MKFLRQFFDWMDTKAADRWFAVFFGVFTILDLSKGHYWSAFFSGLMCLLSIWSLNHKVAKGKK